MYYRSSFRYRRRLLGTLPTVWPEMTLTVPRGIRNNNPGNIRLSKTAWKGEQVSHTDPDFIVFTTPVYGIRAIAKLLLTYSHEHGLKTVNEIISRWAPPVENDTVSYCASVANSLGCSGDWSLSVNTYAVMGPLLKAIIKHENGDQPYSDATILEAMQMAGVHP